MKYLFILFLLINITKVKSQELNLSNYNWNKRVVLILTKEESNKDYISQIQEFKNSNKELEERRLILFEVQKKRYRIINNKHKQEWQHSSQVYNEYSTGKEEFRIILIGLDGGIKVNKKEMISKRELFAKIDSMPMRRAELESKENIKGPDNLYDNH